MVPWCDDAQRRKTARVRPLRVSRSASKPLTFKTKLELALDLVARALDDEIPGEIVLADAAYGTSVEFRNALVTYGLDYAVGINGTSKVWPLDVADRRHGDAASALDLGVALGSGAFRRLTWRDGTRGKLASRFCLRRVKVAHDDGSVAADHDPAWLIIEWPPGEARPTKFALTTLSRRMTKKQIVRILKKRWRTERGYEDLKGELGLYHFEGCSFTGWHPSAANVCGIFSPRAHGPITTTRSTARPERHFEDSFATTRIAIARVLVGWLPRCPLCLAPPRARASPLPHALARRG